MIFYTNKSEPMLSIKISIARYLICSLCILLLLIKRKKFNILRGI